jgi:hypothetical protein
MKKSTTAGLLSAFVFPGAGHLYMKRFVPGMLLAGGAAWALYYLVSRLMSTALEITEALQRQGNTQDLDTVVNLVVERSQTAQSTSMGIASMALLVIWVIGFVDAYRLGRQQDRTSACSGQVVH